MVMPLSYLSLYYRESTHIRTQSFFFWGIMYLTPVAIVKLLTYRSAHCRDVLVWVLVWVWVLVLVLV